MYWRHALIKYRNVVIKNYHNGLTSVVGPQLNIIKHIHIRPYRPCPRSCQRRRQHAKTHERLCLRACEKQRTVKHIIERLTTTHRSTDGHTDR